MTMEINKKLINDYTKFLLGNERAKNTVLSYEKDLIKFSQFVEKELTKVEWTDVNDYKAYMLDIEKFKKNTVNRKLVAIDVFYKYLIKRKIVKENPVNDVEQTKVNDKKQSRSLTKEELIKLLNAIYVPQKGDRFPEFTVARDYFMFELLAKTGMRIEELLTLTFDNIDLNKMEIHITDEFGKSGERFVPFPKSCLVSYKKWIKERNHIVEEKGLKEGANDLLIITSRCGKLSKVNTNNRLERYCEVAGIEKITNHTLRHTFCSIAIADGYPIEKVTQIVGHSTTAFTFKNYVHADTSSLKQITDGWDF